jgi:hypothetical protein
MMIGMRHANQRPLTHLQHVLICYGDELGYYHGAKYQILKNFQWFKRNAICVVTERPDLFEGYPVRVIGLNNHQLEEWSLKGTDHFGIKLQGLKLAIDSAPLGTQCSLLLDTDMYWKRDPSLLTTEISPSSIVLYQNEGKIIGSKNISIQRYQQALFDREIMYQEIKRYSLDFDSEMWGSATIGIHHENSQLLLDAFSLFEELSPIVDAHTVEQFALSEISRIGSYSRKNAKKYIGDWSSIGRKNYVTPILDEYFKSYGENDFARHIATFKRIKIRRPLLTLIQQKYERWKQK